MHEAVCSDYSSSDGDTDGDISAGSSMSPDHNKFTLDQNADKGTIAFASDRDYWVQCPFCHIVFATDSELMQHMEIVHDNDFRAMIHQPEVEKRVGLIRMLRIFYIL